MQIAHMGLSVCRRLILALTTEVMKCACRNRMLPFGMVFEYSGTNINELFNPIASKVSSKWLPNYEILETVEESQKLVLKSL